MILDSIANAKQYYGISPRIKQALQYIETTDFTKYSKGKHPIDNENLFFLVNDYETKENNDTVLEAHRRYIDLQYMTSGSEQINIEQLDKQPIHTEYNEEYDYILFNETVVDQIILQEGMFAIFFPNDLHMPGIMNKSRMNIEKIVVKILID